MNNKKERPQTKMVSRYVLALFLIAAVVAIWFIPGTKSGNKVLDSLAISLTIKVLATVAGVTASLDMIGWSVGRGK